MDQLLRLPRRALRKRSRGEIGAIYEWPVVPLLMAATFALVALVKLADLLRWIEKPPAPAPPVAGLFAVLDSGHLYARRGALAAPPAASPRTAYELERLIDAAGQTRRKRLRAGALRALEHVAPEADHLRPFCPRLLDEAEPALQRAGAVLCLRLRVADAETKALAVLGSQPAPRAALPLRTFEPHEYRVHRERALKIEAALEKLGLERFAELDRRAAGASAERLDRLLGDALAEAP